MSSLLHEIPVRQADRLKGRYMKLIIIPCCGTKNPGGQPTYHPPIALSELIGLSAYSNLMASRRELASLLRLAPGPDLGFDTQADGLRFLPAYQRYNGIIYRTSRLREIYHSSGSRQVVIISALYGLLDEADSIRDYNLAMSDTLNGSRLHTWWQQRGLWIILCEYTHRFQPAFTFDLLSGAYRKAVKPWPDCINSSFPVQMFDYPGQGTGSNYRRGEDLEKLITD